MAKKSKVSEYDVKLREAFRVFDKEGSGSVSVVDFRHVMTNLGERFTDEEVDEIIVEVGTDDQGRINCEGIYECQ